MTHGLWGPGTSFIPAVRCAVTSKMETFSMKWPNNKDFTSSPTW